MSKPQSRLISRLRIAVLLLFVWLGLQAFYFEPSSLHTNHYPLVLSNWPQPCTGLTIVVLADLHVGGPHNGLTHLRKIVSEANAVQPDLVLLVGDYVIQGIIGGEFIAPETAAAVLANLSAELGVYAVLGNHDHWLDARRVDQALSDVGISMLEDTHVTLRKQACTFTFVGVSDFWEGAHDVTKAFQNISADEAVIAFTHNPDVFVQFPRPTSLAIAGHTHGGQVRFPWLGAPIVRSEYGQRFVAGEIVDQGQTYFVSSGTGMSILPVRLGVPPEVSVLRLHRK